MDNRLTRVVGCILNGGGEYLKTQTIVSTLSQCPTVCTANIDTEGTEAR